VKVINAGDLTKDPQVLSRFEREARAAGAIATQYITQVLDAGLDRESNLPFIAMEYMEGEDLQHLVKRVGPLSSDLALRVTAQACLGLQKAHEAKVVHRDIKPHNLFLARRDAGEVVVKMLDFGIAKVKMDQAQSREGMDLTKTGNLLGSPLYVSPEQARGKRQIDHRTDIYSLGAVMYQMLCGRTPFEHATALGELILMVCTENAAPVQDFAPWTPPDVAAICQRCLRKNPDERYQTAQELFDAIRPLLSGGWAIHEDMLVSLEDSHRREEQPRLPMSLPPPAGMLTDSGLSTGLGTVNSMPPDAQTRGHVSAATNVGASTTGPLTHEAPASGAASRAPLIVAAVAAVALAGAGTYALTRPQETAPVAPATTTTAPPPETATPQPPPDLVVEDKRVKVVLIPDDASAEVEGKPVTIKDGLLELVGPPGKVFKVRVFKGISEVDAEVVVTEAGALPPKLELTIGKKIKLMRQGTPAPDTSADESASGGKVGPAPVPTGIKDDTSEFD
jgi:serine/threonine-protein kinase